MKSGWSLSEWLQYQENLHPSSIELGLDRVRTVWQCMLSDESAIKCPIIVVGGTNGKGSTIAFLEAMYLQAGYRPVVYTSPHIDQYNERIRIAGDNVTDQQLTDAFEVIQAARADISLSYFEFGTLAALYIAAEESPDVLILEVGLGGRLDAVNILEHDVALITNISMDHMEWLGDNLEDIAVEKAGIARKDRPLILADTDMPTSLYAQAQEIGAVEYRLGRDLVIALDKDSWDYSDSSKSYWHLPLPGLPGRHQLKNAAAAICAVNRLALRLPVDETAIRSALLNTGLAGRFEKIREHPDIYLDVAHNPAAAQALSRIIGSANAAGRWIAILALQRNRDPLAFITPLMDEISVWYVTEMSNGLGHSARTLADAITECRPGTPVRQIPKIDLAITDAQQDAGEQDHIIVLGSFFTVSEVRAALHV
ncbi:MAG: bifunctional tetrahydrofolate synthase/dihydrofolate synthase [Gammaproteobacteria bacterium]|nr:bifunctional tetrahydrofolate synthase/dihydrofolate synthase [Gammaproteobacteria bacterium]